MDQYVFSDIFCPEDLKIIQKLANQPCRQNQQWWGRYTQFHNVSLLKLSEAVEDSSPSGFYHRNFKSPFTKITEELAILLLQQQLREFPKATRFYFETYLDRNLVNFGDQNERPEMIWHQDNIKIRPDWEETPQWTLVVPLTKNDDTFTGGNLILQEGGVFADGDWYQSELPVKEIEMKTNQAVIFRNNRGGHCVTPIVSKKRNHPIIRDVLIMTCWTNED